MRTYQLLEKMTSHWWRGKTITGEDDESLMERENRSVAGEDDELLVERENVEEVDETNAMKNRPVVGEVDESEMDVENADLLVVSSWVVELTKEDSVVEVICVDGISVVVLAVCVVGASVVSVCVSARHKKGLPPLEKLFLTYPIPPSFNAAFLPHFLHRSNNPPPSSFIYSLGPSLIPLRTHSLPSSASFSSPSVTYSLIS